VVRRKLHVALCRLPRRTQVLCSSAIAFMADSVPPAPPVARTEVAHTSGQLYYWNQRTGAALRPLLPCLAKRWPNSSAG
jgi:hypothetical protein